MQRLAVIWFFSTLLGVYVSEQKNKDVSRALQIQAGFSLSFRLKHLSVLKLVIVLVAVSDCEAEL